MQWNFRSHTSFFHFSDKDREEKTLAAITNARKKITNDIHELSERLKANRESVQKLKEQIEELEENG